MIACCSLLQPKWFTRVDGSSDHYVGADPCVRPGCHDCGRTHVNLEEYQKLLAGESPVRRLLFGNYVTFPAVGVAFREASAK
jgi:hypothetical protein